MMMMVVMAVMVVVMAVMNRNDGDDGDFSSKSDSVMSDGNRSLAKCERRFRAHLAGSQRDVAAGSHLA